jgi:hypothetical protein
VQNPQAVFTDYSGEQAAKLMAGLNAMPPVSEWTAEHILVFDFPDAPIMVGLVERGCVTRAFKIPREDWGRRSPGVAAPQRPRALFDVNSRILISEY